jgi:hypothetical protein
MLTGPALEGGSQRRGAQGELLGHPREALAGCERGAMGTERYEQLCPSFVRCLTAHRRGPCLRQRRWRGLALGSVRASANEAIG